MRKDHEGQGKATETSSKKEYLRRQDKSRGNRRTWLQNLNAVCPEAGYAHSLSSFLIFEIKAFRLIS